MPQKYITELLLSRFSINLAIKDNCSQRKRIAEKENREETDCPKYN